PGGLPERCVSKSRHGRPVSWPGSREALLPPRPLRTERDSFPSYGSSLGQRTALTTPVQEHLPSGRTCPVVPGPGQYVDHGVLTGISDYRTLDGGGSCLPSPRLYACILSLP